MLTSGPNAFHYPHDSMPSITASWATRSLTPSFIDAQATLLAQLDLSDRGDVMSEVTPSHRQRQRPALQRHETCSSTQSVLGLTLGNDAAAGLPDDVPSSEGSAPLGIEPRAFGVGLEPSPVIYQTRQWSDQSAGEEDLPDWTSTFVQAAKTETTLSNTGSIEGRSVNSCGTSCSTDVSAYSNNEEYHRRVLCDDRDQCAGLLGKLKTGAFGLKPIIRVFKRHGDGNQ
ncbi:hypothetical protein I317_04868 [Kwoniella heveanensis CBS 569]|nr:hypothetical protein I317_04868 [Kwoniella heveanensis CBS 569]